VNQLNRLEHDSVHDPEINTRISQYEMAFRMQTSVPDLMDISREPQKTLDLYGARPGDGSFASNCLLARRLAERGVRFIQLYHRDWDHHDDVKKDIPLKAQEVDRASAALINDLRERGMLHDTLVVWGGEFGRTPMAQGKGRDHHIKGFSIWMAGGGIHGGITYGATDEFGYAAVENPVHVNDFHATMLHLFGIDHTRLTYRYQGRDFRLTDIAGEVVKEILI
jgi:arylsulfatase A-like enzyme